MSVGVLKYAVPSLRRFITLLKGYKADKVGMTRREFLVAALSISLGAYLVVALAVYLLQESIIFQPILIPKEYPFREYSVLGGRELWLEPERGVRLNAIHFTSPSPKGAVLFFNGQSGNLLNIGPTAAYFIGTGYDFFAFDYRTIGKSEGELSEKALFEDGLYAFDYLKSLYAEKRIVLYGASLGSGPAAYIASRRKPKLLILRSPYYSLMAMGRIKFPWLPTDLLLKYPLASGEHLKKVIVPIVIFHGTLDIVVPPLHSELLAPSLKDTDRIVAVRGAGHGDVEESVTFRRAINKLL